MTPPARGRRAAGSPRRWGSASGALLLALAGALGAQPTSGPDRFDPVFRKYSKRFFGPDFDWRLFKAQALTESNLDPGARSHAGARGVMQLMPSTFQEVASRNPELAHVDATEWNIAAGIAYDRTLWRLWERDTVDTERTAFMFGSYNAGRGTIRRAQSAALADRLDHRLWPSIETVAPKVPRWRYRETLGYVRKIAEHHATLDDKGRLRRRRR